MLDESRGLIWIRWDRTSWKTCLCSYLEDVLNVHIGWYTIPPCLIWYQCSFQKNCSDMLFPFVTRLRRYLVSSSRIQNAKKTPSCVGFARLCKLPQDILRCIRFLGSWCWCRHPANHALKYSVRRYRSWLPICMIILTTHVGIGAQIRWDFHLKRHVPLYYERTTHESLTQP